MKNKIIEIVIQVLSFIGCAIMFYALVICPIILLFQWAFRLFKHAFWL